MTSTLTRYRLQKENFCISCIRITTNVGSGLLHEVKECCIFFCFFLLLSSSSPCSSPSYFTLLSPNFPVEPLHALFWLNQKLLVEKNKGEEDVNGRIMDHKYEEDGCGHSSSVCLLSYCFLTPCARMCPGPRWGWTGWSGAEDLCFPLSTSQFHRVINNN